MRPTNPNVASVALDEIPERAAVAWFRLRDDLQATLGKDLVALWAYGGTTFPDRPRNPGDLDTYALLGRKPGDDEVRRIDQAHDLIASDAGLDIDAWYVLAKDAGRPDSPRHAFRKRRRDTSWAINRAHWLAGRYVLLHGPEPRAIVPAPTWDEVEIDLRRELEHVERHVAEGDSDPDEAAYAIFNGSRVLYAVETHDVVISKRSAGLWARAHLPARWRPAIDAAVRTYDAEAMPQDADLLAAAMAPFVAMVRQRLPQAEQPSPDAARSSS